MVNVDLYSAIITKVSNALDTLVSGEKPGFQTLSEGLVVLLCAEVVWQRVPSCVCVCVHVGITAVKRSKFTDSLNNSIITSLLSSTQCSDATDRAVGNSNGIHPINVM